MVVFPKKVVLSFFESVSKRIARHHWNGFFTRAFFMVSDRPYHNATELEPAMGKSL
jgi:hypothetical protein